MQRLIIDGVKPQKINSRINDILEITNKTVFKPKKKNKLFFIF